MLNIIRGFVMVLERKKWSIHQVKEETVSLLIHKVAGIMVLP